MLNVISLEIENIPDQRWNERLIESELGTIYQTKEMGAYYLTQNLKPIYLKFVNPNGTIVGQVLLVEFSRFLNRGKKGNILKKIPGVKKLLCKWVYGPLVFENDFASEIYQALGNFLLEKNYVVKGSQHPLSINGISSLQKKFRLTKWSTSLIDLNKNEDELYENITKHSGRKNIERSIKRDVVIQETTESNLKEFLDLLYMNKANRNATNEEHEDMCNWWKILKPIGYSGFLAKKNEVLIGGIMFSAFHNYIIEGGVARSEDDTKMKLYSQDLIKWKIIQWGIKNKMKYYDLAGFNPNPKSKKEEGILRYKKKWGGKDFEYQKITSNKRFGKNFV